MERKEFLKKCAAFTAGAACLDLLLTGCAALPYADYVMDGEQAVVKKTDLGAQGFALLKVTTLPAPVYLTQTDAGIYAAVLLRCTHRGCTVRPAGDILQCPCHGSQYTTTGEVLEGPAPENLLRFPVTTDAETLRIALN